MKRILFLALATIFTLSINGQTRSPKKVRDAFETKYPKAEKVTWTSKGERQKEWTANYFVENDSMQASFDYKANWLFTYTFIEIESLPEAVTHTIMDEYNTAKIILAVRMQVPEFDGFGVAFMYLGDRWGVQITKEGKVVRRRLTSNGI